jgi:Xaa-Pro aminopeptidase
MADKDDPYGVDLAACRGRQRRLLDAMASEGVELVVLSRRESVQWLTGVNIRAPYEPLAAIDAGGRVTLVLPSRQVSLTAAADDVIPYEEKWHSSLRDVQQQASATALHTAARVVPKRIGCEYGSFGLHLAAGWDATTIDVEPTVFALRRHKDADELRMMRRANEANQAMYEVARQIVRPGVNELDVYTELYAAAVKTLGEPPTYIGQDYRSGARGGAARDRAAEAGELYILDLGVGFRGYYSDNCRTLAVSGEPTAAQQRAWEAVKAVFPLVESTIKPGASCRQLFETVQKQLDELLPWVFDSHLGHGVGLAPQEGPHLNPFWDDTFAAGDFLAVEPGLYHEADLRHGVRLEQNYLVTDDGVELWTAWPIEL